jgi:hypothetical protein
MNRLISDITFELAAMCAGRIRELGLTPGTTAYMRGQLGYGDYIKDLSALCEIWNGSLGDEDMFEWWASSENETCFGMVSNEGEDNDWSGPAGYRFTDEDHWRMEQLFRYVLFGLQHSILSDDRLIVPEFDNEWLFWFNRITPLKEDAARYLEEEIDGSLEKFRAAFLDETDPAWRTQPRRY